MKIMSTNIKHLVDKKLSCLQLKVLSVRFKKFLFENSY